MACFVDEAVQCSMLKLWTEALPAQLAQPPIRAAPLAIGSFETCDRFVHPPAFTSLDFGRLPPSGIIALTARQGGPWTRRRLATSCPTWLPPNASSELSTAAS